MERDWHSRVANDPGLSTTMLGPSLGVVQLHKPIGIQIPEITKLLASSNANAASKSNASWCYPIVAHSDEMARRGIIEQTVSAKIAR